MPLNGATRAHDGNALRNFGGRSIADDVINLADGFAAIGGNAGFAHLQFVEFLQNGHGNHHLVFLKIQNGGRVVNQHIGIQNVQLGCGFSWCHRCILLNTAGRATA